MVDVDGVLVNGRPSDGRHWATGLEADLGLRFDVLRDVFFKEHWEDIVTGRADLRERLTVCLSRIAPKLTADQVLAYWLRHDARLDRQLLNDLTALRRSGTPVHLATNQEHERARYLLDTLGLASQIDGCHYSAAIGHRKPTREFFAAVVARVNLAPSELLLIDDAKENVRAAAEAGWNTVLWTGRERLSDVVSRV